ncbi:MAG: peptidase domain-containing ABC transporter [Brevundimonas sp.]|uniref:peptidase domain-containing ABC transporter n=1 Tax=Brevundimonas sp. TaxID=1871086 RepID=UPI00391B4888
MANININQSELSECGLACVAVCSTLLGQEISLRELRTRYNVPSRGMTVADIVDLAASMNISARPVSCDLDELGKLSMPAILHWDMTHFVVLKRYHRNRSATIFDPVYGERVVSYAELNRSFTGVAVEMSKSAGFTRRRERSPLPINSFIVWSQPFKRALLQILLLSLVIQVYVLASPLYLQVAVDEGVARGDQSLLMTLAIGFGLFALFNSVAELLRGFLVQRASLLLNWDMSTRLMNSLVRLPLGWFQRRHLSDVLVRIESLQPIRQLFTNGLVSVVVDGLLSITTLLMMFLFAWQLAVIVLVTFALATLVRVLSIRRSIRLSADVLQATTLEQGKRIETVRAIQTIKSMAGESARYREWSNELVNFLRAVQRSGNFSIAIKSVSATLDAVSLILVVYVGATMALGGAITVGVLFAFSSYRLQFQNRATTLIETALAWKMLDLHADRLADIVLTQPEPGHDSRETVNTALDGRITVEGVGFRHGANDPWILKGVNLSVQPGEFVAIVGPSGSGKSTLLKLLAALYQPTVGAVTIDGRSVSSWGARAVRRVIGTVLQDDELLSGSVLENVSFFADQPDVKWAEQCLERAAVLDEIMAFPMGLNTPVGDLGSLLSGGQKQRILIARALYKRPSILLLDEATSHLDPKTEGAVNAALKELRITRLIVAHRRESIEAADRAVVLVDGKIQSMPPPPPPTREAA